MTTGNPLPLLLQLLHRGHASQLLFLQPLPPSLKIPALVSVRMYQQAVIQLMNQQQPTNLHIFWLVCCMHMISAQYEEWYEKLEPRYREMADEWVKMNRPLSHTKEVKVLLRKKFEELLLLGQEENYFTMPKMPVFLVSCSWLQKLYNDNLDYIPAVDNSDLFQPMPWVQTDLSHLHYNYRLKQSCRENIHYKIIPYQAWQFLRQRFGGMQFRRFTTNQKQPICELNYTKVRIMVAQERYLYGLQVIELLASRYDTIVSVMERVKRIMIGYKMIEFEALKWKWEPLMVSHLEVREFVEIVHDEDRDLIKQAKDKYELWRLEYDHDIEDSEYSPNSDLLVFNLQKDGKSFLDMHSIPYKKTTKKYNKCLTCSTTEKLTECSCKQAYFCTTICRDNNKQHLKICDSLRKQDALIDRLIDLYGINKRKYEFQAIRNGGKVGLENLGNTCYASAALQCVLSVESLNQFLVANEHVKELNAANVLGTEGHLACAYGEFVKDYYTTNRRALQPIKILKIISSKNAQFRGYNHQDSQQFFNYFFDKLHEDLNRVRDKPYTENIESDGRPDEIISQISWRNYLKRNDSFISDNFAGQYRSEIRCPDCDRISITFDPFLSVTLPFPKQEPQEQITGYYLSPEGEFNKVSKILNANTNSQQFLNRYFHQRVLALWLRNKQPQTQWNLKKSVKNNNSSKGVLLFYTKPENSTVEIQAKYDGYEVFHRKIFTTEIQDQGKLLQILYQSIKHPILKATKNEQLIKMTREEFVQLSKQIGYLEVLESDQPAYPINNCIIKIKVKINKDKMSEKLPLVENLKFDVSSKAYEPKQIIKGVRSLNDPLTIPELLTSFRQAQELTEQNAWYCNKCKNHKLAQKIMSVYRTPKYLVLHLKRFNHRGNRYVIYGEKVKTPIILNKVETINGQKYELFGVVNHYGTLSMGHYTAYVKREQEWYHADDSSFRRKQPEGSQAYLLFYRRQSAQ